MSDSDSDLFEDAKCDLPQASGSGENHLKQRSMALPIRPVSSFAAEYKPAPFQAPHGELPSLDHRRNKLRGLRKQMREEFGIRDGLSSNGDADSCSLISENTSLHSWHRKVLAGPSSIVQPNDSVSTCALSSRSSFTTESPPHMLSPSIINAYKLPSQTSRPTSFSSCEATSPTGPPPSHPPPPLPTLTIRSPPPVPPRNPSIRLPVPLPISAVQAHAINASYSGEKINQSTISDCATPTRTPLAERQSEQNSASAQSSNSTCDAPAESPMTNYDTPVQSTPVSYGRRRGHTKTNSLDRGLTLAKSIKTGPFPPPAQKSNSLTRGTQPPEGEEEERNMEADRVIDSLTNQFISEHNSDNTITSTSSTNEDIEEKFMAEVYTSPAAETGSIKRLASVVREARKSETIPEESESDASPAHVVNESGKENQPIYKGEDRVSTESLKILTNANALQAEPSIAFDTTNNMTLSPSFSPHVIDPIMRDVERRMSMVKSQGQKDPTFDDDVSEQLASGSRIQYAKNAVKNYAGSLFSGLLGRAAHVIRPNIALKTDPDDSDSDDGADPSQIDSQSARGPSAPLVRPKNSKKGPFDFGEMKLTQELRAEHTGAVWVIKFSVCGRLMATAGHDAIIRIWVSRAHVRHFEALRDRYMKRADCPPQEMFERSMCHSQVFGAPSSTEESDAAGSTPREEDAKMNVFMPQPFVLLKGHTADVLDLSWSKNNFVLSSGMDRTVKLWHITRTECLCCFQHVDFVTCVAFLPKDDRYFLSGSLDGKLRLWHIPDKKVAVWNEVQVKFITALAFVRSGKFAVVGTYNGRCFFYTADQLKYHTVVDVRSSRGKNARGHKVTGLAVHGDKLLVTSNDSRIRMYDVRDMSLTCKFIGAQNEHSQIRASFAPDGKHVICGSEDKYVYFWRTSDLPLSLSVRKDRNKMWERMRGHTSAVCPAVFAPKPNELLGCSKNPAGHKLSQSSHDKDKPLNESDVIVSADLTGCIKIMVCKAKPIHHASSGFFNTSVLGS